jgi:hypothetical protein
MPRPGRNDACECGSGRKFKHCCALKQNRGPSRLVLALVGGLILIAIIVALSSTKSDSTPGRVWSAEHGHYHDASGREVPR